MKEVNKCADEVKLRYGAPRFMFCGLYGSQNYNLDTENSDVDTKAIILPTIEELLHYKKVSNCFDIGTGQCDVKHIQLMFNNFLKQNINFLELLYTPYFVVNKEYKDLWCEVISIRNSLTTCNPRKMIHAAVGMGYQKYAALEKPFESKIPLIKKYGYDPKQLASMLRIDYFCQNYLQTNDFDSAIHPVDVARNTILSVKSEPPILEMARRTATSVMEHLDRAVDFVDKNYPKHTDEELEMESCLDKISQLAITKYFSNGLM
jgi:predicted nucleotidyltransferase